MRGAILLGGAALACLSGCCGTAVARLAVHPPPLEAPDTAEAQRLRVEESVRDVAAMGRLSCAPPRQGRQDPAILECWPSDMGESPAFVSMHLEPGSDGYAVTILESFCGLSGPRVLCPIQDRLAERLEFRMGGGTFDRDPGVRCPKSAPQARPRG